MTRTIRNILLTGGVFAGVAGLGIAGAVGQRLLDQLPDPAVGSPSRSDSSAQASYDEGAILQLMKLVDLSRTIGGGISQMYEAVSDQQQAIGQIRDAQTGPKSFPVLNGTNEIEARQGSAGLMEMTEDALDGVPLESADVDDALAKLSELYGLEKAFAMKDDFHVGRQYVAVATAQAAVASSTAESAYKRANEGMNRIDGYIGALEKSPDLKTSLDINTRVSLELAQQINESIRVQAAIASITGANLMMLGGDMGSNTVSKTTK